MKKIIVLVPTEKEAAYMDPAAVPYHICGVGQAACAASTAAAIIEEKSDLLILAGIAGAYGDDPGIGQTVAVTSETEADLGRMSDGVFTPLFRKVYPAPVAAPGYPAVDANTVDCAGFPDASTTGAAIENMEGAAFFAVCERFGVPAMEVRTISNRVGHPIEPEDMALATGNLAAELLHIMKTSAG